MKINYFFINEKLTLDMPICKPIEIKKHINSDQQVLALDLGTKRIGVANSNGSSLIATPLTTINRKKFILDIKKLTEIIKENKVMALIIGLPLNMDGTEGRKCQSVRDFAKELLTNILKVENIVAPSKLFHLFVEVFFLKDATFFFVT